MEGGGSVLFFFLGFTLFVVLTSGSRHDSMLLIPIFKTVKDSQATRTLLMAMTHGPRVMDSRHVSVRSSRSVVN